MLGYNSIPNFGVKGERFYHYPNGSMVEMDLLSELYKYNWLTTEIPVQHFINLVEDRICTWRLEELGYKRSQPFVSVASYVIGVITVCFYENRVSVIFDPFDSPFESRPLEEVKTFTDLLTLIRFLK